MEANKLMIGDWVRYKSSFPDKALQGKIARVVGIAGRVSVTTTDDDMYHDGVYPDWLEPIPPHPGNHGEERLERYFRPHSKGMRNLPLTH